MTNHIDLKSTERASYRLAAYADGTSDISLGLVFILLGCYAYTREVLGPGWNMLFFLVMLGLITLGQGLLRKKLIPERIGVVKFGPHVQKRKRVFLLITILLAAGMIATWVGSARGWSPAFPDWFRNWGFEISVALIILGIFWGVAYTMSLRRFYFYGVLLAAGFPLMSLIQIYEGVPFLAAGAIITGIGVFLLNRFLKGFPVGSGEVGDE